MVTMSPSLFLLTFVAAVGVYSDGVPQPYRVVWNYPDESCKALHVNFDLDNYEIDHNAHKFVENTIAIFYSDLAGKWPYIDFRNHNKLVNGGLPKDVDMPAHLAALKEAISSAIKPDAHGFGIIDMENWRPVLHTNYGRYTPYKSIFADWFLEQHPDMPQQQRRREAHLEWKNVSLNLMIESLNAAKEVRPDERWGYYGYPQLVTKNQNVLIQPLWQTITAYYPSIYVKSFDDPEHKRAKIMADVAESFRVRALYGNPSDPIMPYTVAQYRNLGMFKKHWLDMEITLPLEMGIDGVILWASSGEFKPPREKCTSESEFVHKTLGPYLMAEMERMTKCSEQLCTAKGRCVKKEYSDAVPYLLDRGVSQDLLSTAQPSGEEAMSMDEVDEQFRDDYACQCYDGFAGERCTDVYEM